MLKISGEALQGGMGFGVDPQVSNLLVTCNLRLAAARCISTAQWQTFQRETTASGVEIRGARSCSCDGERRTGSNSGGRRQLLPWCKCVGWSRTCYSRQHRVGSASCTASILCSCVIYICSIVLCTCIPMYICTYMYILCNTSCISAHTRRHAAVWHAPAHPDEV